MQTALHPPISQTVHPPRSFNKTTQPSTSFNSTQVIETAKERSSEPTKPKRKKRNPSGWARNEREQLRYSGPASTTSRGKIAKTRQMADGCSTSCRLCVLPTFGLQIMCPANVRLADYVSCQRSACRLCVLPTFGLADYVSCQRSGLQIMCPANVRLADYVSCQRSACGLCVLPTFGLADYVSCQRSACRLCVLPTFGLRIMCPANVRLADYVSCQRSGLRTEIGSEHFDLQRQFIHRNVAKTKLKWSTRTKKKKKKGASVKYLLYFLSAGGKGQPICKKFYLATLGI